MGGDGGCINGRADVVRTKGYGFQRNLGGMGYVPNTQVRVGDDKLSRGQLKELKWKISELSQEPLEPPIAVDRLGRIYNKIEVLKAIQSKQLGDAYRNLTGVSSLVTIWPCKKEGLYKQWKESESTLSCALSGLACECARRGVVFWNCGCLVSLKSWENVCRADYLAWVSENGEKVEASLSGAVKAIEDVSSTTENSSVVKSPRKCPVCETAYSDLVWDVVELVADEEVINGRLSRFQNWIRNQQTKRKRSGSSKNMEKALKQQKKVAVVV